MGATKSDLFTKQQNDIANMAKALAHPPASPYCSIS